tara:strand:+ start:20204 stop:22123 length:1920 start_codon:yes stop_codon:yes gene_type:complete
MWLRSSVATLLMIGGLHAQLACAQVSESTAAYYSDPESLQTNVLNPALSSADIVSADGTTFSAQASCNAETEYLRVYASPQADGDLDVTVVHDHDLDGVFASPQVISDVSGVCHNGYAKNCSSDFASCDFFEWSVDADFNITSVPSAMAQGSGVEGCYCINNSCGAGLYFVNQERIHDDLGTGISLAFQKTNPSFGITNVVDDAGIAKFFGHDPDTCDPGDTSQQYYFDNPSDIPAAAFAASGTSTLFASVSSAQSSGHTATAQTCFEEHGLDLLEPDISDIIDLSRVSGDVSISPCGTNCVMVTFGLPGDNYLSGGSCTQYSHQLDIEVIRPDMISNVTFLNVLHDDESQIRFTKDETTSTVWTSWSWDVNTPPSSCERARRETLTPNLDITSLFDEVGESSLKFYHLVGGGGEMLANIRFQLNPYCESTETVDNTCGAIPSDCYLETEVIDGVTTVSGTVGTGLLPMASSRTFTSGSCSETVSRDYWRIDRTYMCPSSGSPYDFSQGLERAEVVNLSTTETGYDDRRVVEGVPIDSTETLTLPALPTVESCQQTCKTRKAVDELGIATMGLSVGSRPDDTRYEYTYKACVASVCPLEDGETVDTACGCLDRFSEAASAIQAFRLAGQDFVCTTEEPE